MSDKEDREDQASDQAKLIKCIREAVAAARWWLPDSRVAEALRKIAAELEPQADAIKAHQANAVRNVGKKPLVKGWVFREGRPGVGLILDE